MRSLTAFVLCCAIGVCSAAAKSKTPQRDAFVKKMQDLLVEDKVDAPTIVQALGYVEPGIYAMNSMEAIVDDLLRQAPKLMLKFAKYLPTYTKAESCLKKCGTSALDAGKKASPALYKCLTPPYKALMATVGKMKNNKKPQAAVFEGGYKTCTAAATVKIVKQCLQAAKKTVKTAEWKCAGQLQDIIPKWNTYDNASWPCSDTKKKNG